MEQQVVHEPREDGALSRKVFGLVVAASALLVAAGCGSSGTDTTVRSGREGVVAAAEGDVDVAGQRTVTYQGVAFDVPASWPVYDLAAASTCVRFDVNAVYLGHPGADMACPSVVVGRADTALVSQRRQRPQRLGRERLGEGLGRIGQRPGGAGRRHRRDGE